MSDAAAVRIVASVGNLRDLGGSRTADGRQLVHGRLLRSSHFRGLAEEDRAGLAALGIRTVVDLRGEHESSRAPSDLAFPEARIVPLRIEPSAMGTWKALREAGGGGPVDPEALAGVMKGAYGRFVHEHQAVFAELLRLLLEPERYPVVFHCTAGKDRTGFAAALVLLALGVPRDRVLSDYLATNGRWETVGHSADLALLSQARAEYLAHAFDEIEAGWGSPHAYLDRALGFGAEQRRRLAEVLLADAHDTFGDKT